MQLPAMKWKTFVVAYGFAIALLLSAQRRPQPTQPGGFTGVVDLTRRTSAQLAQHWATRIDAPAEYAKDLWAVDQIPPERLFGPLVVIDVSKRVRSNSDYQIGVDDIADWEQTHGQIPQGAIVLARTASDSGLCSSNEAEATLCPGYSNEAARFLAEGRNIFGLGIDTQEVDTSYDLGSVRQFTLRRSVYQIENVANLYKVPETGAWVSVIPTKLKGGRGAPARVVALLK
jgi:kynurenine formamidase